jgi:hypothetical protein
VLVANQSYATEFPSFITAGRYENEPEAIEKTKYEFPLPLLE